MQIRKFGTFLIEIGVIDEVDLVDALNLQRRRELIPLGEIALHMNIISAKQLIDILDYQSKSKDKFGRVANILGYIDCHQLQTIIEKKKQLHSFLGDILVELHKIEPEIMKSALQRYQLDKRDTLQLEKAHKYKLYNCAHSKKKRVSKVFSDDPIDNDQNKSYPIANAECICPICSFKSEQLYLLNSAYSIVKKDIDLKPLNYEWIDKTNRTYNPLLYDIWECPSCHFCADRQHFHDPVCDVSGGEKSFRTKVHQLLMEDPSIFNLVEKFSTNSIENPSPEITYDIAVRRYMIAISILQHVDRISKLDALPLGKYYLHLAWLYREIGLINSNSSIIKKLLNLKAMVANYWRAIPLTESSALEHSIKYYETAVFESTIDLMKVTEHKIFQLLGRIHMYRGDYTAARAQFHEGLKCVYHLKGELEESLKKKRGPSHDRLYKDIIPKLHDINTFYIETNDLLFDCKQRTIK